MVFENTRGLTFGLTGLLRYDIINRKTLFVYKYHQKSDEN